MGGIGVNKIIVTNENINDYKRSYMIFGIEPICRIQHSFCCFASFRRVSQKAFFWHISRQHRSAKLLGQIGVQRHQEWDGLQGAVSTSRQAAFIWRYAHTN